MDVKAEVVLLIFTLNCVTLLLQGQAMIRYRLCQDRFANYSACITSAYSTTSTDPINIDTTNYTTTTTTTTHNPISIDTTTTTTTAVITPTITTTTINNNNTVPTTSTATAPPATTTTITTTPSYLITSFAPLQTQSPPSSPSLPLPQHHHQQFSQLPLQLQSLLSPPINESERENSPLTSSSPPPPPSPSSSSPGFADMDGRSTDDDEDDDVTKEVKKFGLIIIGTFVLTSVASSQVLGRWIDRWSCRTLKLFPLTGVVAWAVCGLVVSAVPSLPLYLWLVGAALGGSSGGFVTLKAAATIYALQATPRWDRTVRLALLQAAVSLGVLTAYLSVYFITADSQLSMNSIFIGTTILGILNVFFVIIFLSDKPPPTPVTSNVSAATTSPVDAPVTQKTTWDSSSSMECYVQSEEENEGENNAEEGGEDEDDGEDDNDNDEKGNTKKIREYEKNVLRETGMEIYDECDGKQSEKEEKEITFSIKTAKKDDDELHIHSSYGIDILVTPPDEDEKQETNNDAAESKQIRKQKEKLGVVHNSLHLTGYNKNDESLRVPVTKRAGPSCDNGPLRCLHQLIPIVSPDDGNSVYGTPPEHSNPSVSRYGTPPSRAVSCYPSITSLDTTTAVATSGHQCGVLARQQHSEACDGEYDCCDHSRAQENSPDYELPQHQITDLSSSASFIFPKLLEARSDAALYAPLDKAQIVNKSGVSDSQEDMLMTPNVLLTPASSLGSVLGCEGSNSSSSSSTGESRDVMRGDEGDIYDCGGLGDMRGLSLPSADTTNAQSSSYDSTSLQQSASMLTLQSESVGEVNENQGREPLPPLTVAGESSGEGICCAGGGGGGRCLACVAGRLLCRPVSVTFRRRAAGFRGIVVADLVAAFLVSVMGAGVWEITPFYLEVKMKWSLADCVSYMASRCGVGVVALVVLLPLLRRWLSLQDTILGVLGGLSSLLSSFSLSFCSSSSSTVPLALFFGSLRLYLNVASAVILVRLVGVTELGGVLMLLGSVEQLGHLTGWFTFHYLFLLLVHHHMPGVAFLTTGLLFIVPSIIFGVLYVSLGLRNRSSTSHGMVNLTPSSLAPQGNSGDLET